MRGRCLNPRNSNWQDYGGRGITVCEQWNSFKSFIEDMGPRPARGWSLDRREVNGNYESSNCRWATDEVQANNKRSNKLITVNGEIKTLSEWCRIFGVGRTKVAYRLKVGYTPEAAFTVPDARVHH